MQRGVDEIMSKMRFLSEIQINIESHRKISNLELTDLRDFLQSQTVKKLEKFNKLKELKFIVRSQWIKRGHQ